MSNEKSIYPFGCLAEIVKKAKNDQKAALEMMQENGIPEKISIIIGYNKSGDYELKAVDAENQVISSTRSVLVSYTETLGLVGKLISVMRETEFNLFEVKGISDQVIETNVVPGSWVFM